MTPPEQTEFFTN